MAFIFEQSDSEIYASHAGLAVAGPIINRHSGLRKRLKSIPLRHGIPHIDLVRTYLGLLCQGKNDFEAVEEVRKDLFFQQALEIGRVPSSARLRQRFDEQAEALTQAADDCIVSIKRVFDLVKDFGTSESPKSTRSSTTHWCPGRPGHPAFRHNIASSLRLHTGLPYDWTPRSDAPLGSPLAPSARRVSRVASRLPGTTRLRFALHGGQRLKNLRATVSALPTGHVALHADVFCLDNSKTRKEGVARTYHGYDGYAPIGAYLGEEGWCVGLELRPGDQHSQKDFLFFLDRVLPRARALAGNQPLLITLDGAHDAAANREYLAREQIDYLIKWNPRKENPNDWKVRAEAEGRFVEVRPGKRVALFDEVVEWSFGERSHRSRRVVQLVERTEDRRGQPLLIPDLVLEGWWTSLDAGSVDAEQVILLYQRRGTSEQFHSEFKSDLDLVRLPSGKFETNALVLALAALAYNILRYIGQNTLIGPDAPIRKALHRRRLRTVMQEMIYRAVRLVRHGRRYLLRFGRGDPRYGPLARCYAHVLAL